MAHAAGWPLSTRISDPAGKGGRLSQAMFHSRVCSGSDTSTYPAIRFRRGNPVSDILVVPYALGQSVKFTLGEGPQLDAIADRGGLVRLKAELDHGVLSPIYNTIKHIKENLPPHIALLGFCGAPWTVA